MLAGTVEGVRLKVLHGDFGVSAVEPAAGLGTLADVNTLAGVAVWSAVLVVTLSLVADIATALLDPRVDARST